MRCWATLHGRHGLTSGPAPSRSTACMSWRSSTAHAGTTDTGKTETVRELARAAGQHCVAVGGSRALDARYMGSLLTGAAQSGAWACIDGLQAVGLGVLSVLAQQLAAVQTALRVRPPCCGSEPAAWPQDLQAQRRAALHAEVKVLCRWCTCCWNSLGALHSPMHNWHVGWRGQV